MARYQLIRKIATGGMAEVFLGRAIGSGGFQKPVAIKRILPHLGADKEFVTRFHDEARLTVHLQHANVVQVFDLGQATGQHVMVLEFVDGDTLRELLHTARKSNVALPLREMVFVVQQVAEGLAYAHEATGPDRKNLNIIHRDINPSNVMVSQAGEVKLADFGIARAALAQSSTATGVVRGKVGYFAPEVARGRDSDQRSDVFLMGLMLYEVLVHRRVFKENDFVKSLMEIANFDVASLQRPDELPVALWDVVRAALHHDPQQRLPTARQLSLKLSSYLFDNRLRVGPTDVAQVFARVFPDRKSALHDLDSDAPVAEVDLSEESATPMPRPSLAATQATRTGVLPRQLAPTDFVPPPPPPISRPSPIPKGSQSGTPTPMPLARTSARPHVRIGDLLVLRKLITQQQLDQALVMQKRVGGQLGDVLVSQNQRSAKTTSTRRSPSRRAFRFVRAAKLEDVRADGAACRALLAPEVAERLRVLPLSLDEKRQLFIAMVNPADIAVLDEVRLRADVPRVTGVMIRPRILDKMIERLYQGKVVELDLPAWAGEQSKMLERFGAQTSDHVTGSREQVFGETEIGDESPAGAPEAPVAKAVENPRPSSPGAVVSAPSPAATGAAPVAASALDLFIGAAAAREDVMGRRVFRLLHLVRGVATAMALDATARASLERQAVALFMGGQLEQRRPFEAPGAVVVKQLLAGVSGLRTTGFSR